MRVLVLGGTRFIGAHVVRRLRDAGHAVLAFHRGASSNPVLPDIDHVLDPRAEYPITAFPSELQRNFDVVVHMVAMGAADTRAAVGAFVKLHRRSARPSIPSVKPRQGAIIASGSACRRAEGRRKHKAVNR